MKTNKKQYTIKKDNSKGKKFYTKKPIEKKQEKKMVKLYKDNESLVAGLLGLTIADKDIAKVISTEGIASDKVMYKSAIENMVQYVLDNMVYTEEPSPIVDLRVSSNKAYLRMKDYCSFGWNKYEKDDKISYRIFYTLYGYKAKEEYLSNLDNRAIWKELEE